MALPGMISFMANTMALHQMERDTLLGPYHRDVEKSKKTNDASRPGHGTFLQSSASSICWGTSFVEALEEKYGSSQCLDTLRTASLVGPSTRTMHDASCVYVSHAFPGHADEGVMLCPALQELDMSRSLLSSWDQVARITRTLPLNRLTLQHVRLQKPELVQVSLAFEQLTHLSLGDTATDWAQILVLGSVMPKLTSLELAHNEIDTLATADTAAYLPFVQILNLEGNRLNSWEDIVKALSPLPRLQKLILTDNPITHINFSSQKFPVLSDVHLTGSALTFDDLEVLESCLDSPTWSLVFHPSDVDERQARIQAVSRLAKLVSFNHTPITQEERIDAERYYISRPKPNDPRYDALVEKHGHPPTCSLTPAVSSAKMTSSLQDKLIQLYYIHSSSVPTSSDLVHLQEKATIEAFLKTAPCRLVHRRLVALLRACQSANMYAVMAASPEPIVLPLDDPMRDLAWYGLADYDLIVLVD